VKKLALKIIKLLSKKKLKISFVESCTGGLLSSSITSISGSSKVFTLGLVTYSNQSKINISKDSILFKNKKNLIVGRYHSLKLKEPFKIKNFEITMRCLESKVAMAFENNKDKIYGFQFHPESFLTVNGNLLIKKILSA